MYVVLLSLNSFAYSVPELSFIEPQGLTSDHVKELTEEVDKLAKENVGEVRRERERGVWGRESVDAYNIMVMHTIASEVAFIPSIA